MDIDDKIKTARALIAEAESKDGQVLAILRGLLGEIEEELRTLRIEAARRQMQYYTRKEFAALMRVSPETIRRAEVDGVIKPAVTFRSIELYSSLQVEWADEIFSRKRGPTGRPRERKQLSAVKPGETVQEIDQAA